jgi:N-methylhydantoinase B
MFDPLTLEILWSRLISLVDEMAATMLRTSFSTVIGGE